MFTCTNKLKICNVYGMLNNILLYIVVVVGGVNMWKTY